MAAGAVIQKRLLRPLLRRGRHARQQALCPSATPPATSPTAKAPSPAAARSPAVALMDARSIAATAANGGRLTPATELDWAKLRHDPAYYFRRVHLPAAASTTAAARPIASRGTASLRPQHRRLARHAAPCRTNLLLHVASAHHRPGDHHRRARSPRARPRPYRSNPLQAWRSSPCRRKDPAYVGRAKDVQAMEKARPADPADAALPAKLDGMLAALKAAQP